MIPIKPKCPYCGTTNVRQVHDGGGYEAPEYTCEDCFTPRDDGPSFDDLRPVPGAILTPEAREANERLQRELVRKMQEERS